MQNAGCRMMDLNVSPGGEGAVPGAWCVDDSFIHAANYLLISSHSSVAHLSYTVFQVYE
jgi:hypothetical protein